MIRTAFLSWFLLNALVPFHTVHGLVLPTGGSQIIHNQQHSSSPPLSRHAFLRHSILLVGSAAAFPIASIASEDSLTPSSDVVDNRGGKPYAPPQALIPAMRLKLWFDSAQELSPTLAKSNSADKQSQYEIIGKMDAILSKPPELFLSEKGISRSSGSTAQITTGVSSANKAQYQKNRASLSLPDQLAAMLNQADVERQWGMLQYAESQREKGNEMRAAFNYYTSQLQFGESYKLTASKEERKQMIRNDALPTATAVITSDLDLRDLYRNTFLTAIEDVKAEVSYQLRQDPDAVEVVDVLALMDQANTAIVNWFGLIPSQDVNDALKEVISNES